MIMHRQFQSFDDAIKSIQSASTKIEIEAIVDKIESEYAADTLQVTPENWGELASAVLVRGDQLGVLGTLQTD